MQTVSMSSLGSGMCFRRVNGPASADRGESVAPDEVLVTRAQSGNQAAWTELDSRWRPRMVGLAMKRLGGMDEVQDVVQQAFLAAYQGLRGFKRDAKFGSWLYTITSNKCHDWLRRRMREEAALDVVASSGAGVTDVDTERNRELREAIRKAVTSLPVGERRSVSLALWGYTRRQIAERLGWPPGTVSTRVRRAQQKLRDRLSAFKPGR